MDHNWIEALKVFADVVVVPAVGLMAWIIRILYTLESKIDGLPNELKLYMADNYIRKDETSLERRRRLTSV